MNIRPANLSDIPTLAILYRQTVITNAPAYYTPAQTEVWASFASDTDHFREFILGVATFVAVSDADILGFAGIGDDGHVSSTYVRHDCLHQGIGSRLMQAVLDYATQHRIRRLYAEASDFSLGLFKKFGFQHDATEVVERNGVKFERYLVARQMNM
ncbi:MAG: GNAT family N-acetyltransferase [Cyanobacteria bacterium P01_A01_bin.37]